MREEGKEIEMKKKITRKQINPNEERHQKYVNNEGKKAFQSFISDFGKNIHTRCKNVNSVEFISINENEKL